MPSAISLNWRKRSTSLPLLLPLVASCDNARNYYETSDVLEDIVENIFIKLHRIQKDLEFWQDRAKGSRREKLSFMICETGPWGFILSIVQLIHGYISVGSGMQMLCSSANELIDDRIKVLQSLRVSLATFLAQVYIELDQFGDGLARGTIKSPQSLLLAVDGSFSELKDSLEIFHASRKDDSRSFSLTFKRLSDVYKEESLWQIQVAKSVNSNLEELSSYLLMLILKHRKPRRVTRYWMRYTCGAIGISVCSFWLLKHSMLIGNPDILTWFREARDSSADFFGCHIQKPLLSLRDELFPSFRKSRNCTIELEEVKSSANSLRRMLLRFCEQTQSLKFSETVSDQDMLEVVMERYEKELMHPIQNLVSGELVPALLIQIQKLKLNIEKALLELDQILKANAINFALLAALPALLLSLVILAPIRAWLKLDTKLENRGARCKRRLLMVEVEKSIINYQTCIQKGANDTKLENRGARCKRRLLMVEVEKSIINYQTCIQKGANGKDVEYMFGLVLYSLGRLCRDVERAAKESGEWHCLRQDIAELGKPGPRTEHQNRIFARLDRVYDSLRPP